MTMSERLAADYAAQSTSTGPHPMKLWRERTGSKILLARDLHIMPPGMLIQVGGMVICRQRPGTAKGHCFISLEDESGISNLFVPQKTFEAFKLVIVTEPFLLADGRIQISEGDQPTVYVTGLVPLPGRAVDHVAESHAFR
ncbi:MAG: dnaE [Akkermansiaceae bacterium]|nr:dnaE [Akkermansiaceae bacterium]